MKFTVSVGVKYNKRCSVYEHSVIHSEIFNIYEILLLIDIYCNIAARRKKTVNQCRLEEKEKAEQVPFDVIMKELEEYELQEKSKNELE